MKRTFLALIFLFSSATLCAQTTTFHIIDEQKARQRVEVDFGMTQIHTKAANIRIAWLPFLAPLPYSYPRTMMEVPNPLVLMSTPIPQRPHERAPEATVTIPQR
ncbi:MAG TPA: hypothetical protein VKL19_13450 [Thermoanaerobaculia bacterium]|nr:hypothetical protein [Thermoanaerobaculia bacterium]